VGDLEPGQAAGSLSLFSAALLLLVALLAEAMRSSSGATGHRENCCLSTASRRKLGPAPPPHAFARAGCFRVVLDAGVPRCPAMLKEMTVQDELSLQPWPQLSWSFGLGPPMLCERGSASPRWRSCRSVLPWPRGPPNSARVSGNFRITPVLQDLEVRRGGAASAPRSGPSTPQIVRDVM